MTSRNCWHRSLRTPGREQSCTTACARCVSAANSSPSLKNIRRDIPKMPRRFVSVTVSRLRSHTLHLQVREASWLSLSRSFVTVITKRENRRDGYCSAQTPLSSVSSSSVSSLARASCAYTSTSFYGVIVVGNGGGSVACCDFSHYSSSRMCGGVAWDWSMCLQGAGGRWRGSAQRAGQREFFLW